MDEDRHTSWCDALKAGMTPLLMTKKNKNRRPQTSKIKHGISTTT